MADLKTQQNEGDVDRFLESVENERRRREAFEVKDLMTRLSGEEPKMWGNSIVGYGRRDYTTKSGSTNQWFKIGFSPRKQTLTLYIMDGFSNYESLLEKLGPHSTGKACLYIKDLEKVDRKILEELITRSLDHVAEIDKAEP